DAFRQLELQAQQGDEAARGLVDQLDKLSDTARKSADFARLTDSTEQLRQKFDEANERAYSLKSAIQQMADAPRELEAEFSKASRQGAELGSALTQQESQLEAAGDALRAAGVDTAKLVTEEIRL